MSEPTHKPHESKKRIQRNESDNRDGYGPIAGGSTDEEEEATNKSLQTHIRKKQRQLPPADDHLLQPLPDENPYFFRLHLDTNDHAAAASNESPLAALLIRGTACAMHTSGIVDPETRDQYHMQILTAPSSRAQMFQLEEEIITTTNPGSHQRSECDYEESNSATRPIFCDGNSNNAPSSASSPRVVLVDRFDVRLLLPESELLLLNFEVTDGSGSSSSLSTHESSGHESEAAAIESVTGEGMAYELSKEGGTLSDSDFAQLQQERYQDLINSQLQTAFDASVRNPTESAQETHVSASRVEGFHFSYVNESFIVNESPLTASSVISIPPQRVNPPPPPPPARTNKRPPPPPPRSNSHPNDAIPSATPCSSSSSSSVATVQDVTLFTPPFNVPVGIDLPPNLRAHRLMLHTCKYVQSLGQVAAQQEIMLKLKQQHNVAFNFLNYDHPFHRYYMWLKEQNIPELEERIQQQLDAQRTVAVAVATTAHPFTTTSTAAAEKPAVRPPPGVKLRVNASSLPSPITQPPIYTSASTSAFPSSTSTTVGIEATAKQH